MGTQWKEIYRVEEHYQGHIIKNSIEEVLNYDIKRDFLYRGESIYVSTLLYEEILAKTMPQLIRRKPHGRVEWIDYNGVAHDRNKFSLGTLVLTESYANQLRTNKTVLSQLARIIDLDTINVDVKFEQRNYEILHLESDIICEDDLDLWRKLRFQGISTIIEEKQSQFVKSFNVNSDQLFPYVDSFIPNNWIGKSGKVIQYVKKK